MKNDQKMIQITTEYQLIYTHIENSINYKLFDTWKTQTKVWYLGKYDILQYILYKQFTEYHSTIEVNQNLNKFEYQKHKNERHFSIS